MSERTLRLNATGSLQTPFEDRLSNLIRPIPVSLVYVDRELRIRSISDLALILFGQSLEEVLHHSLLDFLAPETRKSLSSRYPNVWAEDDTTLELEVKNQSGALYRVRASFTADLDEQGDSAGAIVVMDVLSKVPAEKRREYKSDSPYGITNREHQVLEAAASGKTSKMIADMLEISHETVNKHIAHVLVKMGASTRVDACVRATQEGWLSNANTNPEQTPQKARGLSIVRT